MRAICYQPEAAICDIYKAPAGCFSQVRSMTTVKIKGMLIDYHERLMNAVLPKQYGEAECNIRYAHLP